MRANFVAHPEKSRGERQSPRRHRGGRVCSRGVKEPAPGIWGDTRPLGFAERGKSNANSDGPGNRYLLGTWRRASRRHSLGFRAAERAGRGSRIPARYTPRSRTPRVPGQRMHPDDKAVRFQSRGPDGSGKLRERGNRFADECPNARYEEPASRDCGARCRQDCYKAQRVPATATSSCRSG